MAYESVRNKRALNGAPSPWATKLARHVARELVERGTGNAILPIDEPVNRRVLMVLPIVSADSIEVLAFYRPHLTGKRLSHLYYYHDQGNLLALAMRWKEFGHAYVYFRIIPHDANPISFMGHHASIRAVDEIDEMGSVRLPTLRAFDVALGSALEESGFEWSRLINERVALLGKATVAKASVETAP